MKIRSILIALAISAILPGMALAATSEDNGAKPPMKDRFDRLDQDKDGRISAEEFKAGGKFRFGKMDVDGDGVITMAELEKSERAERIAKRFERMDADANGKVTAEEFALAGARLFQHLDENEDAYLSKDELEKRRSRGGKPAKNQN